jgi:hypothetical protein
VELIIHQVVERFQINIDRYVQPKNPDLLMPCFSIQRRGTKAKKIKKVSGDTGQEAYSNKPDARDKKRGWILFNQ